MNFYIDREETRLLFRHLALAVAVATLIGGSLGGAFFNETIDGTMLTDMGVACISSLLITFVTLIRRRKKKCPSP